MVNSKHFTQCYIRPWGGYSCHQYWQRIALRSFWLAHVSHTPMLSDGNTERWTQEASAFCSNK